MTQVGQRVEWRLGRYAGQRATVVATQRPWLVLAPDRDPDLRVAVLHEEVRYVADRDARARAWHEVT